jgi:hypothetical protein
LVWTINPQDITLVTRALLGQQNPTVYGERRTTPQPPSFSGAVNQLELFNLKSTTAPDSMAFMLGTRWLTAALLVLALPAFAAEYPVQGVFAVTGQQSERELDCKDSRRIAFRGDQRTDTGGGVSAFHNRSITRVDDHTFDIIDEFSNGLIYNAKAPYRLVIIDRDRLELILWPDGKRLRLRRCR